MARKVVPVRLSDREIEMQQETNKLLGAENVSDGIRLSIAQAYVDLVIRGGVPALKPGQTIMTVPTSLVADIDELIRRKK